jgi:hypothetical protein
MITCDECGNTIPRDSDFAIQDKTGRRFCLDCADDHCDVSTVPARGCSCSRGGNPSTCECREDADTQAEEEGQRWADERENNSPRCVW